MATRQDYKVHLNFDENRNMDVLNDTSDFNNSTTNNNSNNNNNNIICGSSCNNNSNGFGRSNNCNTNNTNCFNTSNNNNNNISNDNNNSENNNLYNLHTIPVIKSDVEKGYQNNNNNNYNNNNILRSANVMTSRSDNNIMTIPAEKEIRKSIIIHGRRDYNTSNHNNTCGIATAPTNVYYRKGFDTCGQTSNKTTSRHNLEMERNSTGIPLPRTPMPKSYSSHSDTSMNYHLDMNMDYPNRDGSFQGHSMSRRNPTPLPSSPVNVLNISFDLTTVSDPDSTSTTTGTQYSTEPNSLNSSQNLGSSSSSTSESHRLSNLNNSQNSGSSLDTSQYSGFSLDSSQQTGSSLNISNNSESRASSASASAPADGNVSKTEPLSFGDPRQRQVFEALTGIQNLRRYGHFHDVTIQVKEQDFRCHRFILSNASPFFRDLLDPVSRIDYDKRSNFDKLESNNKLGTDGGNDSDKVQLPNNNEPSAVSEHNDGDGVENETNNITNSNNNSSNEISRGINNRSDKSKDDSNEIGANANTDTDIDTKTKVDHDTSSVSKSSNVVLTGVEPRIFDKVLDFVYCVFDGVMTDDNALELLLAADSFELPNLSQTCVAHIAETVSVDNVYDVISLVDSGCTSLSDHKVKLRCHQVLRENFLQLCDKNEFLGLSRTRMISLVADSMLGIRNEIDLIHPLIRWVEVKPSERCADLTLMLQLIRFPLMTFKDMDRLLEMPFLNENSLAKALIEESKTYSVNDFPDRMSWPRQNCISRCHFSSRDFILWTADRDKGLHLYSIIDGHHYKITTFNEATMDKMGFTFDSTSTVCCYGHRLFFTGGEFKTDLAWSIDTGTGEVSVHSKMPRGRKAHSMVVSRGCVYCLGGQDKRGYTVLDSVDAYIISKDLWVKVGHMAVAAYNMTAVVSGGAIYMIGGVDHSGQPLRLVQCFAVLRSSLYSAFKIEISNMPPSLLSPRAVTSGLDGSIYVVCGHGEVYRLDVEKRCLHHINTLKSLNKNPRFRFGLAHVGGCLVVNGGHQLGHNKHEPVRSVCMDIATKAEVKDYSPLLPADIINTCFYAKLNSGILGYSKLSNPGH